MNTTIVYEDSSGRTKKETFTDRETLVNTLDKEVKKIEIKRMTLTDKTEIRRMLGIESALLTIMEQHIPGADVRSKTELIETPENNSKGV